MRRTFVFIIILISFISYARSQEKMDFEKYNPTSTLVVPEHKVTKAKFPFIDVHCHQESMPSMDLSGLIKEMDKLNMTVMVNLSGRSGNSIVQSAKNIKEHYPKRFIVFANVNFSGVGEKDWGEKAAKQLEEDVKNGANGLKVFKNLGLSARDINGKLIQRSYTPTSSDDDFGHFDLVVKVLMHQVLYINVRKRTYFYTCFLF